ncbi:MAG: ABC transporter substrate-binding protein [Alphaproteobacteria bacterium]|nr:ABC transporter substrate-binding protein [Alphaproteobacteria bacterium]
MNKVVARHQQHRNLARRKKAAGRGEQEIAAEPHTSPAVMKAVGEAIQPMANPRVGPNQYMLANPEGPMMTTGCKEKDAAREFMQYITSSQAQELGELPGPDAALLTGRAARKDCAEANQRAGPEVHARTGLASKADPTRAAAAQSAAAARANSVALATSARASASLVSKAVTRRTVRPLQR